MSLRGCFGGIFSKSLSDMFKRASALVLVLLASAVLASGALLF